MDDQERGKGSPHRIGKPPDPENDGNDDPHADESRVHKRHGVPEGPHVGDADSGPRKGQDQRREGIEEVSPRHFGPGHHPGHGNPDSDTDEDGNPRIEQAVEDELGRLDGHPLEILQGVLHRNGGEGPASAEGIERDAQIRDEGKDQSQHKKSNHPRLAPAGDLLSLDHRIGKGAVILDGHVLLGDDQKEDGQDDHDGRDDDPHLEEPPVHKLDDVQIGLGGKQVVDAHHQRRGEVGEGPDEDQKRPGDITRGGQRKGDVPELPQPPRSHALRRLIEGGRYLSHGIDDAQGHQRKEVQGLHQQDPVDPVHEIDRL